MISFLFFLLVVSYFFNFFSFLNSLLILEGISLLIFLVVFSHFFYLYSFKFLLFYFVFIVSESSIGLSILVKSVKHYGFSNFRSMSISMF